MFRRARLLDHRRSARRDHLIRFRAHPWSAQALPENPEESCYRTAAECFEDNKALYEAEDQVRHETILERYY